MRSCLKMKSLKVDVAIFLGASSYPKAPHLNDGGSSFKSAHYRLKVELMKSLVDESMVLDLFDSGWSASDQYEKIEEFLMASVSSQPSIKNLFVFYIGHGGVSDSGQEYFLTIRDTRRSSLYQSSLLAKVLASLLRKNARELRRFIFLDSCFSAAAISAFQGAEQSVVKEKLSEIRWDTPNTVAGGTAIICAAAKGDAAKYLPDGTMFSNALLSALTRGDTNKGEFLTFEDIYEVVRFNIEIEHPDDGVLPELHTPDQKHGLIHRLHIFRNPCWVYNSEHSKGDDFKDIACADVGGSLDLEVSDPSEADDESSKIEVNVGASTELVDAVPEVKQSLFEKILAKFKIKYAVVLTVNAALVVSIYFAFPSVAEFFSAGKRTQGDIKKTIDTPPVAPSEAPASASLPAPAPAPALAKKVFIDVDPKDAKIEVMGQKLYNAGMELLPGNYNLRISRPGYVISNEILQVGGDTDRVNNNYSLKFREFKEVRRISGAGFGWHNVAVSFPRMELIACKRSSEQYVKDVEVYDLSTLKKKKDIKSDYCAGVYAIDDGDWFYQWRLGEDWAVVNANSGALIEFKFQGGNDGVNTPQVVTKKNKAYLEKLKCKSESSVSKFVYSGCNISLKYGPPMAGGQLRQRTNEWFFKENRMCWGVFAGRTYCADASGFSLKIDTGVVLKGHAWDITDVDWMDDEKTIVTSSRDGTIRLWDKSSGKQLSVLQWLPEASEVFTFTSASGDDFILGRSSNFFVLWKRESEGS